ncbi:MAG: hypothetical protein MUF54_12135 [Polyangiaceae bacterium]|jgi:hypothetical protein|nr:hypothetical protein [Polyangiaceae bacterium]
MALVVRAEIGLGLRFAGLGLGLEADRSRIPEVRRSVVGTSQHQDACCGEKPMALHVSVWRWGVLRTVGLDSDAGLFAEQVHDGALQRLLTTELEPNCTSLRVQ